MDQDQKFWGEEQPSRVEQQLQVIIVLLIPVD